MGQYSDIAIVQLIVSRPKLGTIVECCFHPRGNLGYAMGLKLFTTAQMIHEERWDTWARAVPLVKKLRWIWLWGWDAEKLIKTQQHDEANEAAN